MAANMFLPFLALKILNLKAANKLLINIWQC